ncbi:helix-turn-helix transcriptional regulator [Dyella nitratireducens]
MAAGNGCPAVLRDLHSVALRPQECRHACAHEPSRELEVFALLPRGLTNAAIAKRLGIAASTLKSHVERILQKLGCADRTQAAVHAAKCGFH